MADLSKTVEIIYKGVDNLTAVTDKGLIGVNKFSKGIQSAALPVAALGTAVIALEKKIAKIALTFAKDAVDASLDFTRAQAELQKVLNDGEGSVEDYTDTVFDLSNTYAVSSAETLESIANWKNAGFTADESAKLTKNALDLMIAGSTDAATSTEILTRIIQGFGFAVDEIPEKLDFLNEISQNYAVNVVELSDAMGDLSPLADILGFTFEELAGLVTPVIEVFRNGGESARGLRTGLLSLVDPTKEQRTLMDELKIAYTDGEGKMLDVKTIVQNLAAIYPNLTKEVKAEVAATIAGKDQAARFQVALRELGNQAEIVAVGMAGVGNSIDKEVNTRLEGAPIKVERLRIAFENLQVSVGRQFQDDFANLAQAVANVFTVIQGSAEAGDLSGFFDAVNVQLNELKRIADEIAAALPEAFRNADYSGFSEGIEILFGDLSDVSVEVKDVIKVIEDVADAFKTLAEFTDTIKDIFIGIAKAVAPVVDGLQSLDSETVQWIGTIAAASFAIGPLTSVVGLLSGGLGAMNSALKVGKAEMTLLTAGTGALTTSLGGQLGLLGVAAAVGNIFGKISFQLLDSNDTFIKVTDSVYGYIESLFGIERPASESIESQTRLGVEISEAAVQAKKAEIEFNKFVESLDKLETSNADDFLDTLYQDLGLVETKTEITKEQLEDLGQSLSQQFGVTVKVFEDGSLRINSAFEALPKGMQITRDAVGAVIQEIPKDFEAAVNTTKTKIGEYKNAAGELIPVFRDIGDVGSLELENIIESTELLNDTNKKLIRGVQETDGSWKYYYKQLEDTSADAAGKVKKSVDEIKEEHKRAADQAHELQLKLLELASDERIAAIEAKVTLNVAEIEADAKKVVAAFDSISNTVTSTGDVISSLFGELSELDRFEQLAVFDAIEEENRRRDEALKLQRELTEAQIDLLRAQEERARKGEALIKVEAANLSPALTLVWTAIMREIQVLANQEGQEFLLSGGV